MLRLITEDLAIYSWVMTVVYISIQLFIDLAGITWLTSEQGERCSPCSPVIPLSATWLSILPAEPLGSRAVARDS